MLMTNPARVQAAWTSCMIDSQNPSRTADLDLDYGPLVRLSPPAGARWDDPTCGTGPS
jgi:hypothetical protein